MPTSFLPHGDSSVGLSMQKIVWSNEAEIISDHATLWRGMKSKSFRWAGGENSSRMLMLLNREWVNGNSLDGARRLIAVNIYRRADLRKSFPPTRLSSLATASPQ
jgi:hypothetical protein